MDNGSDKEFDGFTFPKVDGVEGGTGNDLYNKAKAAVAAGLAATASQYIEIDKKSTSPNKSEKSLTTTGNPDE
jgi:hypothetical protein